MRLSRRAFLTGGSVGALVMLAQPPLTAARGLMTDATPYDGEGIPQKPTTWIDKGVVAALAYGRFWAQQKQQPATGSPDGWQLDGGTATRDELIKGVKRGVLTC